MAHRDSDSARSSKAVSYRDTLSFGIVFALVVFAATFIFTRAWQSVSALGLVVLYTAITFAVVSGGTALMNFIVSKDRTHYDPDQPFLD